MSCFFFFFFHHNGAIVNFRFQIRMTRILFLKEKKKFILFYRKKKKERQAKTELIKLDSPFCNYSNIYFVFIESFNIFLYKCISEGNSEAFAHANDVTNNHMLCTWDGF